METRDLKNDPAFPTPDYIMENSGKIDFNPMGMSKRFYAACAAMQGLYSNPAMANRAVEEVIASAYAAADELLKQENK